MTRLIFLIFPIIFIMACTEIPPSSEITSLPVEALSPCVDVTEIPITECNALVMIYKELDGKNWHGHDGWLKTTTPCSWQLVECHDQHVIKLTLNGNNLKGYVPVEIGHLTQLQELWLGANAIEGFSGGLGQLTQLTHLSFG